MIGPDLVDLFESYRQKDQEALAELDARARAEQLRLRVALHRFVARQWDDARGRGLDPGNKLEWEGVGRMSDLLREIAISAAEACHTAGDPPQTGPVIYRAPVPAATGRVRALNT